ncbi:MAG: glycosyltransferase family 39 protein [Elusimicrobia bacterium]|nr:glycosyltransferase family 39 protein [Elusimicrobiota bacterium]
MNSRATLPAAPIAPAQSAAGRDARAWLLAIALGVSVLSHLKGVYSPPLDYHHHRQINTSAIARNYHRGGLDLLHPKIDWEGDYQGHAATEMPLYMWLMGLLWPFLGLGELWGRWLSIASSALTALYLFKLCERRLGQEPAFYASVFFSCLPLEIYFGRNIQPDAFALLGGIAALYHWDRWLSGAPPWHWLASVIAVALSIGHKLPHAYILGPLAALVWARMGWRGLLRPGTMLALALSFGGVLAWYRHASTGTFVVPTRWTEFAILLEYDRLPYNIWHQFSSRFPELSSTYGGLALAAVGARELFWRKPDPLFLSWFASVAGSLIMACGYSYHHEYSSLPFTPVNAALMGLGLFKLKLAASAPGARRWALAGVAALALSVPAHGFLRIRHWYRNNFPFLAHAGAAADAVSRPTDLFVCNDRTASTYLYYLDRKGWGWDLREAGEASLAQVDSLSRRRARFYMTRKDELFLSRDNPYARHFYGRYPVVYDRDDILIFQLGK